MKTTIFFVGMLFAISAAASAQRPDGDGGNHKDKPGYKVTESSGTSESSKKDYRIEIEDDRSGIPAKIKFLSPDSKMIKTIPYDRAIVAKSGRSVIYQAATKTESGSEYEEYDRSFMDARGRTRWTKKWKNYPKYGVNPEDGYSGWFEGISDNGERSFVTYRDTDGIYYLVVLDDSGKEIAKVGNPELLAAVEISPDGKLVGAETYLSVDDRSIKHFFFLSVDTGKTRLVKAEGEEWEGKFIVNFTEPKITLKEKIYLNVTLKNEYETVRGFTLQKTFRKYLLFNELPTDMAELVEKAGEGK